MVQITIKKPSAILFDVSGTAIRESFAEKLLFPYFKIAYRVYMENNWLKPECQDCIERLAKASIDDIEAPDINYSRPMMDITDSSPRMAVQQAAEHKRKIISQTCEYVDYCLGKEVENVQTTNRALAFFRLHVWYDGYERGKLVTPMYSDVPATLRKWNLKQGIKLYVLSNGCAEASRRFLEKTSHGDLNPIITEHFDSSLGSLKDPETFRKVSQQIQLKPEEILFLTKSPEESLAAQNIGINVILVLTHTDAVEEAIELCENTIPIARTFTNIEFE